MDKKGSYMLQRDEEESRRLNAQSKFLQALFHGHLIHPSIPRHELRAVADVGTGTGVWLEEVQQELDATSGGQTVQLTGFDVSGDQFPRQKRPGVEFLVHDAVQPFPIEYHNRFDLVHLRFLSYGIQADRLESFVDSVLQILR
jgi:SAM-dependent methyltransferase